ncbi:MAG: isoprenyl transferase [Deltaproteobacteria bacterium]|nr:isoprenyl transferase [Deltaproteobacteria bacterium]
MAIIAIDKEKLPRHLAIIMDGNGRWARQRFLPRISGHRKGIEVARDMVTFARELGIQCLTLYTFSKENWNRPAAEVKLLMNLLESHLRNERKRLNENNIRFRAIGEKEELPRHVRSAVEEVEALTNSNDGMLLQLALSYSGRAEIVNAVKRLARLVEEDKITADDLTEALFEEHLYTYGAPDPDLLIRTSGESRISNFLLWQMAYAEIYISEVLWPDFTREDLVKAIRDYQSRERRFGLTVEEKIGVLG